MAAVIVAAGRFPISNQGINRLHSVALGKIRAGLAGIRIRMIRAISGDKISARANQPSADRRRHEAIAATQTTINI